MVFGVFYGTSTFCKGLLYNSLGRCHKKKPGTTQEGMLPTKFTQYNGQYLCIKRDKELTYHKLVE